MDAAEFRVKGKEMVDFIADYIESLRSYTVSPGGLQPGFLHKLMPTEAPKKGEEFGRIMADCKNLIIPGLVHQQSPNFHAYYPVGHSFPSLLGEMLSTGLGAIVVSWRVNPAGTELEGVVMDWLGKLLKLPEEFLFEFNKDKERLGGGCIQNTASEAVLVTMLAARRAAIETLKKRYPEDDEHQIMSRLIVYASDQVNSCVDKATMLAAVKLRKIPTSGEDQSMGIDELEKAIKADKNLGLHPIYLCASLGTTQTCAFDDLTKIGPICQREAIWLHVDAAYAGPAFLCPEFRPLLDGVEHAESFNFNPHKLMLTQFDCSALWIRHKYMLIKAMKVDPIYLSNSAFVENGEKATHENTTHENTTHKETTHENTTHENTTHKETTAHEKTTHEKTTHEKTTQPDELVDYRDWEIPLGRGMRAMKLWFVLRMYGVEGIQRHVRNHVKMAKIFENLLAQDSRFEQVARVVLGLVCFKVKGSQHKTIELLQSINTEGLLIMTPGEVNGEYMIRFAICSEWVQESDIHYAWQVIQRHADRLFHKSNGLTNAGLPYEQGVIRKSKRKTTSATCIIL